MIVAVLDSNAFDVLAETDARLAAVEAAVAEKRVRLLTVHHVRTEVAAIPDRVKRDRLLRLVTYDTPAAFILGSSVLGGLDVLGSEEEAVAYNAVRTRSRKHLNDASVLGVAARNGAAVVTLDKRLGRIASREGVPLMKPADLLAALGID